MRAVLLSLLLLFFSSVQASTRLSVYEQAALIEQIPESIRLAQALERFAPDESTYWLAATFGDDQLSQEMQQRRAKVLSKLQSLQKEWQDQPAKFAAASTLIEQFKTLSFAHKTFRTVDPDRVRLKLTLNPVLQGHYTFYFPKRPEQVQVIGLVKQPQLIKHKALTTIASYVKEAKPLAGSAQGFVTVIQPDGRVQQAAIGYWLKSPAVIAPGATIFIGFEELPKDFSELQQELVELLRYQIYWWKS